MKYDYYDRVRCPICGIGELRAVNSSLARCTGCEHTMSSNSFEILLQIRALPETVGEEASACGPFGTPRGVPEGA